MQTSKLITLLELIVKQAYKKNQLLCSQCTMTLYNTCMTKLCSAHISTPVAARWSCLSSRGLLIIKDIQCFSYVGSVMNAGLTINSTLGGISTKSIKWVVTFHKKKSCCRVPVQKLEEYSCCVCVTGIADSKGSSSSRISSQKQLFPIDSFPRQHCSLLL